MVEKSVLILSFLVSRFGSFQGLLFLFVYSFTVICLVMDLLGGWLWFCCTFSVLCIHAFIWSGKFSDVILWILLPPNSCYYLHQLFIICFLALLVQIFMNLFIIVSVYLSVCAVICPLIHSSLFSCTCLFFDAFIKVFIFMTTFSLSRSSIWLLFKSTCFFFS